MVSHMPGTGEQFLREFLYVDVNRVRSLLAQLAEGAPEQYKVTEAHHRAWQANVRLPVGGHRGNLDIEGNEQTRVMGDLHLAMLEEAAETSGFLRDISEELSKAKNWKRGKHLRNLREGDLIRVTAETRVSDPRYLGGIVRRFGDVVPSATPESLADARQLSDVLEVMFPAGIVVRSFPAGHDEPECHLVGILSEESSYLSTERNALFSRFGYDTQEWTLVAQVARIPDDSPPAVLALGEMKDVVSGRVIDRMKLEEHMAKLATFLEQQGIAEAPKFPAIAVTPLALYRHILTQSSNV